MVPRRRGKEAARAALVSLHESRLVARRHGESGACLPAGDWKGAWVGHDGVYETRQGPNVIISLQEQRRD